MITLKSLKLARQDLERKIETAKGQLLDAIGAETLRAHSERLNVAIDKLVNLREDILSHDNITNQEDLMKGGGVQGRVGPLLKGEVRRFFFICSKFLLAQN